MCNKCNNSCNSCSSQVTTPCQTNQCACPIFLTTDCVTSTEDLVCSNIMKGQTLSEVINQLDAYICTKFGTLADFMSIINVGNGAEIYKGDTLTGKKQLKSLVDSNLINITEGTDTITITVDEAALDTYIEANQLTYTVSNIGASGASIFKSTDVTGDSNQFNLRKIKSSNSSIIVTEDTDEIDITIPATNPDYKVYSAVLNQVSTSDPTATVLGTNTIGNIVWTRSTTGIYLGTLVGAFTVDKSFHFVSKPAGTGDSNKVRGLRTSSDVFQISTHDNANTMIDSALNGVLVEIRVYN